MRVPHSPTFVLLVALLPQEAVQQKRIKRQPGESAPADQGHVFGGNPRFLLHSTLIPGFPAPVSPRYLRDTKKRLKIEAPPECQDQVC
jgi:hypothetical protein